MYVVLTLEADGILTRNREKLFFWPGFGPSARPQGGKLATRLPSGFMLLLVLVGACLAPLIHAQEVQAPHGSHQDDVANAEKDLKAARDLGDELIVGSRLVALGKAGRLAR